MRYQDNAPAVSVWIAWATTCIALIALIASAKIAAAIVAPTVLAGLFALTLSPLVREIERSGMPRAIAAGLVVAAAIGSGLIAIYWLAPSAEDWRWKAPSVIRSLERQVRDIEQTISDEMEKATGGATILKDDGGAAPASGVGSAAPRSGDAETPTQAVLESGQKLITDTVLAAPQILLAAIYIAFLCYFMLAERVFVWRGLLAIAASHSLRLRMARAMREVRQNVSRYLLVFSAINAGLGMLAALIFYLTGLPNPLLWGAMVAVLNFMPYIGPMISNIVVLCVGLTSFASFGEAALPVVLLVMLNILEGQLVTPTIVGRRSQVSALSVFLALAFGAWLWGAIGALVATPLLIIGATVWRHLMPTLMKDRKRSPLFKRAA